MHAQTPEMNLGADLETENRLNFVPGKEASIEGREKRLILYTKLDNLRTYEIHFFKNTLIFQSAHPNIH